MIHENELPACRIYHLFCFTQSAPIRNGVWFVIVIIELLKPHDKLLTQLLLFGAECFIFPYS